MRFENSSRLVGVSVSLSVSICHTDTIPCGYLFKTKPDVSDHVGNRYKGLSTLRGWQNAV